MMMLIRDGKPVIVLVCPECERDVHVRWPERWKKCDECGERVDVPEPEDTLPA